MTALRFIIATAAQPYMPPTPGLDEPEVAHVDYTESQARANLGNSVMVSTFPMERVDRAITEGDTSGFIKVIHCSNEKLLGGTIVSVRAGEMIHAYALAMDKGLKIRDLAESIRYIPPIHWAACNWPLKSAWTR